MFHTMNGLSGNTWIAYRNPNPQASVRLFCIPYAGGSASIYRAWANGLAPEIEVCPIQLPGRETRLKSQPFNQLRPLVEALAPALYPYLDKPFAFFGHSMGALICFELARHLRRLYGIEPVSLFVSAHRAPQLPDTQSPTYFLPEKEFKEELYRLGGTPEELLQSTELMQAVLPLLRADFEVCETYKYVPEKPLTCPILAFGGLQDEEVCEEQLLAWRDQTASSFTSCMLPGNHFFLHTARADLLKAISQELASFLL